MYSSHPYVTQQVTLVTSNREAAVGDKNLCGKHALHYTSGCQLNCLGLAALCMATGTAASSSVCTPLPPVGSPARSVLIPPPLPGPQCQLHILYSCPSALHLHCLHSIPTLQCDVVLAVIDSLIPHPLPSSHHPSPSPSI